MYTRKFGNKYNKTPQLYNGNRYDSKKEAEFAKQLDLRKKAKDIKDWERQVKIPLAVNGKHIANYYIDFKITNKDGSIELVEIKGFETEVWRLKWKLTEALLDEISPGAELIVIK
jgi:hypothetical protein